MRKAALLASAGTCAATVALACASPLVAQDAPAADPADIASVDAIVTALYDVISGPIGEARDRDRFMSLFAQGARLIPTGRNPQTGQVGFRTLSPEEYWANSAQQLERIGFTEAEIGRTTETFGNVTHAFSSYASFRQDQGDPGTPFSRGINSIQLLNDGNRWWVVSIFWDSERPDNPNPSLNRGFILFKLLLRMIVHQSV